MKDEDFLEQIRNGDKEAFISFVDKYKKKVLSMCYSYTEDYGEAEDVSQEAFIAFYKSINNFRNECSLSSYLYRITLSKCLNYRKKKTLKFFTIGLLREYKDETSTINVDEKNYIRDCIRSLPNSLRTPLVLYYYAGLSYKEIAEILNITERAVEGKLYRAKQKLKAKIEKEEALIWDKNLII